MTFTPTVERWRSTVNNVIRSYLSKNTTEISSIGHSGMTIYGQGNTNTPSLEDIILATIQRESGGIPEVTGDNGNSVGLMQLNWGAGTPQGLGYKGTKADLYAPETNIFYGLKYFLKQLARYSGNVSKAILAYGSGTYMIDQAGIPVGYSNLTKVLTWLGITEEKLLSIMDKNRVAISFTTIIVISSLIFLISHGKKNS